MLVACATAASLFPFIGTIVYLIVRPPEYLEDARERQLEIAAAEARLASLGQMSCQYCGFEVERPSCAVPSCLRRLKEPCTVCGKPLDPRWKICPYCEAEVGAGGPGGPSSPAAARHGRHGGSSHRGPPGPGRPGRPTVTPRPPRPTTGRAPSGPPARRASARSNTAPNSRGEAWTGP